jgi:hypothetical protein
MMSGLWKEAYEIRNKYQILVGIPDEKGSLHDLGTDGRIIYRPINELQCHDFDVEWSTLSLRIREIPGSNSSQETGYTDSGFSCLSSVSSSKFWIVS